jgi:hypothetical protein
LYPAKFEEQPQNVPTIADLLRANPSADKTQLLAAEKILLETLEWNAHSATHLHFAHCYISKGILFPKDTIDGQPVNHRDKKVIIRCIDLIAKVSLDGMCPALCCSCVETCPRMPISHSFLSFLPPEYSLLSYDQSLSAAAGVAVARRFCRVNPVWPDELAGICGYKAEQLRDCYETVWKMFRENFPDCDSSAGSNASPKCVTSMSFVDPNAK